MPAVDWVLLGSGESSQGWDCESLYLEVYLALAGKACNKNNNCGAQGTQVPAAPGQAAPVAAGQQLVQAADTVMKTAQEAAAQQAPPQQAG